MTSASSPPGGVLILASHLASGHGDRIFDLIADRVGNFVVVGAGLL